MPKPPVTTRQRRQLVKAQAKRTIESNASLASSSRASRPHSSPLAQGPPRSLTISTPTPFFKLPGEIRNKIYDLVIIESQVSISGSHPNKELASAQKKAPNQKHQRPRYRLHGKYPEASVLSAGLLFTCRQIHAEVLRYVYSRTTFCFDTIIAVNKFLNLAPKEGISAIKSLKLTHRGYAEPELLRFRKYKLIHEEKWGSMLARAREAMTALRSVEFDMIVYDWPCRLELTENWAQPILAFAGTGFDHVKVRLKHERFNENHIDGIAKLLENTMLTRNGRIERMKCEEREAELAREGRRLARTKTKVLKVTIVQ